MKFLCYWFLFLNLQVYSQSYLNLHLINGTYKNSLIGSLKKITLSTTYSHLNFHLNDGTIASEYISSLNKITLDVTPLGEPLPVELSMFTAVTNGSSIILSWRTDSEVSNYGFEIERSSHTNHWIKIGFVKGNGNSNSPKEYSFTDSPTELTNFLYRLKQIDTDGNYKYSNIVSVDFGIPTRYELKQNFPNPFNPSTNINYSLPVDGVVAIKVYDLIGNEIETIVNEQKTAGNYFATFNGSKLSSGVYICTIVINDFRQSIKMMVLK